MNGSCTPSAGRVGVACDVPVSDTCHGRHEPKRRKPWDPPLRRAWGRWCIEWRAHSTCECTRVLKRKNRRAKRFYDVPLPWCRGRLDELVRRARRAESMLSWAILHADPNAELERIWRDAGHRERSEYAYVRFTGHQGPWPNPVPVPTVADFEAIADRARTFATQGAT